MQEFSFNPDGYTGEADRLLPKLSAELADILMSAANSHRPPGIDVDTVSLRRTNEIFAQILVDFAFDIHSGTGIWNAYERCNLDLFGTFLPLTASGADYAPTDIHLDRVHHFLWVIYSKFFSEWTIAPDEKWLAEFAAIVHRFLKENITPLPTDSPVKRFLATPNEYGWDLKKKLIWVGTQSFLLRLFYWLYIEEEYNGEASIAHTDDFLCQECTILSGLGVIELLASILVLNENDRRDLLRWRYRYLAPYKVLSSNKQVIRVQNIMITKQYLVRMNDSRHTFKKGQLVIGSLVPYRKEWYWSGSQRTYDRPTKEFIDDLTSNWRRRVSRVICRYDEQYRQKVKETMVNVHATSLAFYGTDLKIYPDGLSMAADWEKELREIYQSKPEAVVKEVVQKHNLSKGRANISLSKELLESTEGIGVFLNSDEGKEMMQGFNHIISGLKRRDQNLTEDERAAIQGLIRSDAISPAFVKRVVQEYGGESLKAAFKLSNSKSDYWLEYLLRCHKGEFFRTRYPAITLV